MSFASRSLPPEPDFPAPEPPSRLQQLIAERERLRTLIRPHVRSHRQQRICRQIAAITAELLRIEGL